ncbi:MAG TPA: hypothetical protein PKC79_02150 [Solidesulfovibrio magneticus]|nr:hypothetical protein [Solidesulfovibrio magneticus]
MKWWPSACSLAFLLAYGLVIAIEIRQGCKLRSRLEEGDTAVVAQVVSGDSVVVLVPVLVQVARVTAPDPLSGDPETQAMGELARDWLTARLPKGTIVTLRGGATKFSRTSAIEDAGGNVGDEMVQRGLVQPAK